jgi:sugar/nucleoside kinase (ribokinase family)
VETRIRLLQTGRERGGFTVASVLTSEAEDFRRLGGFALTDLLAVNADEAGACGEALQALNQQITVAVTDGPNGSYLTHGGVREHIPPVPAEAAGTGGAGDAYLAGMIVGLCCNLTMKQSAEVGTLLASLSVTSPDTIHQTADAKMLLEYAKTKNAALPPGIAALLA